ncbi:hypothetical protein DDD_2271 [Nonlabens dokdonensis DSW-6]|uniref:Sulfotransferase domain-containing protein n=1 Tax=Nonlabens dokdonensis (strain DSM 17205 / KCTC 12402 / DSW-6) TaxID=592029 RepID=L7WEV0_NONDD|nr:hypothetical protein DDD_2271 [Nonlabens dokdonensis DSW-6]
MNSFGLKKNNSKIDGIHFITAFPKSGSSFISLVISDLLGYPIRDLIYSHFREQDIYLPELNKYLNQNIVSKHHTLATEPNIDILKENNIHPIILIRNLADVVISLRDHIVKTLKWPHFEVPLDFDQWNDKDQFNFLIEMAIPWYIFFYVSWRKVEKENKLRTKFICYEEFNQRPLEVFKQIFVHYNLNIDEDKILASMNNVKSMSKNKNRLNKGIIDRSSKLLTVDQINKIHDYTKFYPNIDFEPIL